MPVEYISVILLLQITEENWKPGAVVTKYLTLHT